MTVAVLELDEEALNYNTKTAKLAEVIDTYGIDSPEFEKYKKRHGCNKYSLLFIYKKYGIKSHVFFQFIKLFIIKQMKKFTYNDFDDDLVIACYIHMVNAHCGYYSDKLDENGNKVWVAPYVDDMSTITATRWINFLITICRSTVCNRDYHLNKHNLEMSHNDRLDDHLSNAFLENLDYANYSMKHFIFEKSMQEHLSELFENKPVNNVLYAMVQWSLLEEDEIMQTPTSYNLVGSYA